MGDDSTLNKIKAYQNLKEGRKKKVFSSWPDQIRVTNSPLTKYHEHKELLFGNILRLSCTLLHCWTNIFSIIHNV